jgi:hypothetical protein
MTQRDQALAALAQANAARLAAQRLKAGIRAAGRRGGAVRAAQAVQAATSSLRFAQLLRAVPGVGDETARLMLRRARVHPEARVDSPLIVESQRTRLVGALLTYANNGRGRRSS